MPNERKGRSQTDVSNTAISTISTDESIVEKCTLRPQLLKWSELREWRSTGEKSTVYQNQSVTVLQSAPSTPRIYNFATLS